MFGSAPFASAAFGSTESGGSTLTYVSKDLDLAYAVHTFVSRDLDIAYSVDAAALTVSKNLDLAYSVSAFVSVNLNIAYSVEAITTFVRAPAGDGYRPRSQARQSRPPALQGIYR